MLRLWLCRNAPAPLPTPPVSPPLFYLAPTCTQTEQPTISSFVSVDTNTTRVFVETLKRFRVAISFTAPDPGSTLSLQYSSDGASFPCGSPFTVSGTVELTLTCTAPGAGAFLYLVANISSPNGNEVTSRIDTIITLVSVPSSARRKTMRSRPCLADLVTNYELTHAPVPTVSHWPCSPPTSTVLPQAAASSKCPSSSLLQSASRANPAVF